MSYHLETTLTQSMRFTRLLGFKLFLIVLVVMTAGTFVFTTLTINWHTEQYIEQRIGSVASMSDVLKRSMRYSMMLNRREDITNIISTVGNEPGIEVVRLYNKRGEITFSSALGQVGSFADLNDEACNRCHVGGSTKVSGQPENLTRIFPSKDGGRVLGMITPIRNDTSCSAAPCHAHAPSQTVLGILDVMVPLKELDASIAELKHFQYFNGAAMAILVILLTGLFIWYMVNIPVKRLRTGMEEIRRGNLSQLIVMKSQDEIGMLADSFNQMTAELHRTQKELRELNRTLEERVKQKTEELRRAQSHMIQMERMVSLGTLAATVAHELNNPLEGVLTYAKLLKRKFDRGITGEEAKKEVLEELSMIADETARCGNIVKNLLLFSREKVGEFMRVDLRAIVEQSVHLIDHHLKMHNITLTTQLGKGPVVLLCDQSQIEQALLALEINAVEAMPGGGTLSITIEQPDDHSVDVSVSDTGVGIRQEDMVHIFEPFYTTKRDGRGTGLGLSVVYGIVERHGGSVDVTTKVNEGTTFTMRLPNVQPQQEQRT